MTSRKLFIICMCIGVSAFAVNETQNVFDQPARNDLFQRYVKKIACAKELKTKLGASMDQKSWSPALIAQAQKRIRPGISLRNSKTGITYRIWGDRKSVTLETSNKKNKTVTAEVMPADGCAIQRSIASLDQAAPDLPKNKNEAVFTDDDLFAAMKKNNWGVIYVWSPYMPLSVQGIAEIKNAVEAEKGNLTVLLDPRADLTEAQKWVDKGLVQKSELRRASSNEIADRGLGVHYPAAYIFHEGYLANADYVGYKKSDIYAKWIQLEKFIIREDLK